MNFERIMPHKGQIFTIKKVTNVELYKLRSDINFNPEIYWEEEFGDIVDNCVGFDAIKSEQYILSNTHLESLYHSMTQEDYNNGWRLWDDEKPVGNSYFYTYEYYDGAHYTTFYVTKDRRYYETSGLDGPLEDINDDTFKGAVWHPLVELKG